MDMLQIDRSKLMRDEPLLYRELQGVCTLCPNKQDCSFDLAGGFDGIAWDEWWLHCPNSAMLTTIGALQKCGQSPRHVSASAFSHLRLPERVAAGSGSWQWQAPARAVRATTISPAISARLLNKTQIGSERFDLIVR